mmetsp:Transcript_27441/g.62064  ORF Transcript_27441/g.62064 Transcript_27441/m.62064 type:complete len:246 (-) Transcript_27441:172-909(-)
MTTPRGNPSAIKRPMASSSSSLSCACTAPIPPPPPPPPMPPPIMPASMACIISGLVPSCSATSGVCSICCTSGTWSSCCNVSGFCMSCSIICGLASICCRCGGSPPPPPPPPGAGAALPKGRGAAFAAGAAGAGAGAPPPCWAALSIWAKACGLDWMRRSLLGSVVCNPERYVCSAAWSPIPCTSLRNWALAASSSQEEGGGSSAAPSASPPPGSSVSMAAGIPSSRYCTARSGFMKAATMAACT